MRWWETAAGVQDNKQFNVHNDCQKGRDVASTDTLGVFLQTKASEDTIIEL